MDGRVYVIGGGEEADYLPPQSFEEYIPTFRQVGVAALASSPPLLGHSRARGFANVDHLLSMGHAWC